MHMKNANLSKPKEEAIVVLSKFLEKEKIVIKISPISYTQVEDKYVLLAPQLLVNYAE